MIDVILKPERIAHKELFTKLLIDHFAYVESVLRFHNVAESEISKAKNDYAKGAISGWHIPLLEVAKSMLTDNERNGSHFHFISASKHFRKHRFKYEKELLIKIANKKKEESCLFWEEM